MSSCSSRSNTQYLFPPQAYLIPCERSVFNGKTYGDAIEHLIKVMAERDLCASQIDSIREWTKNSR
ncbi:Rz1-like lysis system protein LysC [Ursidibacter arcticus]